MPGKRPKSQNDKLKRMQTIEILPMGWIKSPITGPHQGPAQGQEAKIKGQIIIKKEFSLALNGLKCEDYIWVLCWFHLAKRDVLQVYPRLAKEQRLAGVFASRSQDRPNPIGLELVKIIKIDKNNLFVEGLDAINDTPVLDIKLHVPQIDCPKQSLPPKTF
jgi:tRNA-Thr(GGU) m(6)t(6)A37 methyltransferase TsaA